MRAPVFSKVQLPLERGYDEPPVAAVAFGSLIGEMLAWSRL